MTTFSDTDPSALATRLLAEGERLLHQPHPHEPEPPIGQRGICNLCYRPSVLFRDVGGARPMRATECSVLLRAAVDAQAAEIAEIAASHALLSDGIVQACAERNHAQNELGMVWEAVGPNDGLELWATVAEIKEQRDRQATEISRLQVERLGEMTKMKVAVDAGYNLHNKDAATLFRDYESQISHVAYLDKQVATLRAELEAVKGEHGKANQAIGWIIDACDAAYIEDSDNQHIHELFNIAAQTVGITRRLPDEYERFDEASAATAQG